MDPPRPSRRLKRLTLSPVDSDQVLVLVFALVRLCLGFVRLLLTQPNTSEEFWERLMVLGQLNVRRMSGDRIASVCRLRARASNYLPPILLSCFMGDSTLDDRIRGLCCVPNQKVLLSLVSTVVRDISYAGEVVGTKIGACFPFDKTSFALFALVNKLPVEISDSEKILTVTRSDSVPPKHICPSGKR